ncbi:MAG: hypothetical protein KF895_15675 [Parvibaculum sp.]|uniref:hypothetical protein n=1 Tax=Chelatococcus sp. TaxID=1953771 RepID=UPI001ED6224C|nr:hypothetical protein [Chelatococcus sp.]MBX3506918.1 hypothetical protein [Parvibaculum sp.]MBX3545557.1 hypothetical protein [Chelatococcus sp.]
MRQKISEELSQLKSMFDEWIGSGVELSPKAVSDVSCRLADVHRRASEIEDVLDGVVTCQIDTSTTLHMLASNIDAALHGTADRLTCTPLPANVVPFRPRPAIHYQGGQPA